MKTTAIILMILTLPIIVSAQFEWVIHTISTGHNPRLLHAVDLDQDGDQDFISSKYNQTSWWENDGTGSFTSHVISDADTSAAYAITTSDLDLDGDVDIIFGNDYYIKIGWWENDGLQNFTLYELDASEDWCFGISADDVDGDGDKDIIWIGADQNLNGEVSWYENDGTMQFTHHLISEVVGPAVGDIGDIDQDGDADILATDNYVLDAVLWTNNGTGLFTPETLFSVQQFHLIDQLIIANMNGDSLNDVLYLSFYQDMYTIAWYHGDSWQDQHVLGTRESIFPIRISDLDADGDMDVVNSTWDQNVDPSASWENLDGSGLNWNEVTMVGPDPWIREICPMDVDGDGDQDVVGVAYSSQTLFWWELVGDPPPPGPVTVMLTPSTLPLQVPQGGSFEYAVMVRSNLPGANLVDVWTEAVLPSGNPYGPIWTLDNIPLLPGSLIHVNSVSQAIPMFAPEGVYTFRLNAGIRPGYVAGSGEFELEVVTQAQASAGHRTWGAWGYDALVASGNIPDEVGLPASFALQQAYPNPFNPTTTISVALPEAADLTVTVVNTLGQQVTEITNGRVAAGTHAFTFDASQLANGIYFVHATVPGELNAVQKVVLMK